MFANVMFDTRASCDVTCVFFVSFIFTHKLLLINERRNGEFQFRRIVSFRSFIRLYKKIREEVMFNFSRGSRSLVDLTSL